MNCLKCGKEIPEKQVFCDRCLASMNDYPVKPDARVHLPTEPRQVPTKKSVRRKRVLSAVEQIAQLKNRVRNLSLIAVILAVMLCLTAGLLAKTLLEDTPELGRNYTITETP